MIIKDLTRKVHNIFPVNLPDAESMREMYERGELPEGIRPPLKKNVDFMVHDPNNPFDQNGFPDDTKKVKGVFY